MSKTLKTNKGLSQANVALSADHMPFKLPVKTYEIALGDNIKVTEDKRSRTRITNFPFEFPDETTGVLIICRIKDEDWKPNETISSINITFK